MSALGADDLAYLTQVLGRPPMRVVDIPVRDAAGRPRVIVNHPLPMGLAGPPLPNLCWLVDPDLVRQVSQLERAGGVKQAETWISSNPININRLREEHREYAARRWALLATQEQSHLISTYKGIILKDRGVAGVAERVQPAIKCLHAHWAWSLWRQAVGLTPGVVGDFIMASGRIDLMPSV